MSESTLETLLRASIDLAELRRDLRAAERINAIQAAHIAILEVKLKECSESADRVSIFHRPQAG